MPRIPIPPQGCDCHVPTNASEDIKLKILESNIDANYIPKDLKNKIAEDLVTVTDNCYVYVQDDGSPKKITATAFLAQAKTLKFEIVQELPEVGSPTIIYLVPVQVTEEKNIYKEYIYINGQWEQIGSTEVDLSAYRKSSEQDVIDATKQPIISDLETIREGAAKGMTALQEHQSLVEYAKLTEVDTKVAAEKADRLVSEAALQQNIDAKASTTYVDTELAKKQDILTAGTNINITNNIVSALDAKIDRNFTTNITVGHLDSGTDILASMTLKEILYKILYEEPPVEPLKAYYYTGTTIPTTIDSSWTSEDLPTTITDTGLDHTYVYSVKSYIAVAFNKSLGNLLHVYQNGLTQFDLVGDMQKSEVTYEGVQYYLYTFTETSAPSSGDRYQYLWK